MSSESRSSRPVPASRVRAACAALARSPRVRQLGAVTFMIAVTSDDVRVIAWQGGRVVARAKA